MLVPPSRQQPGAAASVSLLLLWLVSHQHRPAPPRCLPLQELITLGVLAVVVTFLLQDGMGAAAVRAYADASARTRGVEKADPANEATMYAIFQTNLVYWVLFGVLGRYVIPGMLSESVPGSPGLWHGGLSAVLPALLVFGHGRKWF